MRPEQAEALAAVAPADLGAAIRRHRLAKSMTQGALAGEKVSIGYVSRIESGTRKPDLPLLEHFAAQLDTSVDELLGRPTDDLSVASALQLDYAELDLRSGDFDGAAGRCEVVLASVDVGLDLRRRARLIRASAAEGLGRLSDAISELEEVLDDATGETGVRVAIALSRCYRESGDLTRAIRVCEPVLTDAERLGVGGTDDGIRLAVTIAAAYFELGDTDHAIRQCRRALSRAQETGSARGQAAAFWNASVMESERGDGQRALELARRAVALLQVDEAPRNLARLKSQLGLMQLRLDPPETVAARVVLEEAGREMETCDASVVDRVRNALSLARVDYLEGDNDQAEQVMSLVVPMLDEVTPQLGAEVAVLRGQMSMSRGNGAEGRRSFQEAARLMTQMGADRSAAQLWFDLAGLLDQAGDDAGSRDAYRRAAASTGLREQTRSRLRI